MQLPRGHVGDLLHQFRCVDILPQVFYAQKSMQLHAVVDRHGDEAVNALRMQPVVYGTAGGVIP